MSRSPANVSPLWYSARRPLRPFRAAARRFPGLGKRHQGNTFRDLRLSDFFATGHKLKHQIDSQQTESGAERRTDANRPSFRGNVVSNPQRIAAVMMKRIERRFASQKRRLDRRKVMINPVMLPDAEIKFGDMIIKLPVRMPASLTRHGNLCARYAASNRAEAIVNRDVTTSCIRRHLTRALAPFCFPFVFPR